MKRTALFLATNLAVIVLLSLVLNIIYATTDIQRGSLSGLLILAALFGFGGSFISLLMSKSMALRSVRGQVIQSPRNDTERWLLRTVERQAKQAGIGMPTVAIYEAPDINAFATGAKRDDSLVAVSSGLLRAMTQDEAEAVLAHEVSHIANGDMITMTLMQGVVNTFVMFLARIVANVVASNGNGQQGGTNWLVYFGVTIVLELVLGFFASFLTMWYSRHREFHADAGAASLVGKEKMIAALRRLKTSQESQLDNTLLAFGINGKKTMTELLMSHPPLDKRIAALNNGAYGS
jgi:heat shock protein HtpX